MASVLHLLCIIVQFSQYVHCFTSDDFFTKINLNENNTRTDRTSSGEKSIKKRDVTGHCPGGWVTSSNEEMCYRLFTELWVDYKTAYFICAALGGSLAMPKLRDQNSRISSLGNEKFAWIGLTDKENNDGFVWEDNEALGWAEWGHNQPIGGNQNCVVVQFGSGKWFTKECSAPSYVMCQINMYKAVTECTLEPPLTNGNYNVKSKTVDFGDKVIYSCNKGYHTSSGSDGYVELTCLKNGMIVGKKREECIQSERRLHRTCGGDWTTSLDGQFCYRLFNATMLNQRKASSTCAELNGTLAMPKVVQQNSLLASLGSNDSAWIGLTDPKNDNEYVWIDNDTLVWENWARKEPDHCEENCVVMQLTDGLWFDTECTRKHDFFCQVNIDDTATECRLTTPPANGGYSNNSTVLPLGSTIFYSCKEGFQTISGGNGSVELTCLINGKFGGPDMEPCVKTCPPGWLNSPGGTLCYGLQQEGLTQSEAVHRCKQSGGKLAEPKSPEQNNVLEKVARYVWNFVWIGLNDIDDEMTFVWGDGTEQDWFNWGRGEPDNKRDSEDCVAMYAQTGEWSDTSCGSRYFAFCQVSSEKTTAECELNPLAHVNVNVNTTTVSLGTTVRYVCDQGYVAFSGDTVRICLVNGNMSGDPLFCVKRCPAGWKISNDNRKCYKLYKDAVTYDVAHSKCDYLGGKPAMPKKKEDALVIRKLTSQNTFLWIGLVDIKQDRVFVWADNVTITSESWVNWRSGRPDSKGNSEFCTTMHTRQGYWDNMYCESERWYVCEIPITDIQSECPVDQVDCGMVSRNETYVAVGARVTFTCAEGCESQPSQGISRTCLANGRLSGDPLVCYNKCPPSWTTSNPLGFCYIQVLTTPAIGNETAKFELRVILALKEEPSRSLLDKIDSLILN